MYAISKVTIPIADINTQDPTVHFHPNKFVIAGIPYIAMVAPMYVQALVIPLAVAALPVLANLPGKQHIKRKLIACEHAVISAAKNKQTICKNAFLVPIKKITGILKIAQATKIIAAPRTSFEKVYVLCNAVITTMLIIAKIGNITENNID